MNTTQARTHRFAALALALMMTLGMLGTVNHLATSEPTAQAAELARAGAEAPRS